MFSSLIFHTFDTKGSDFGAVCLVAPVEVQRSCWGFHMGLFMFIFSAVAEWCMIEFFLAMAKTEMVFGLRTNQKPPGMSMPIGSLPMGWDSDACMHWTSMRAWSDGCSNVSEAKILQKVFEILPLGMTWKIIFELLFIVCWASLIFHWFFKFAAWSSLEPRVSEKMGYNFVDRGVANNPQTVGSSFDTSWQTRLLRVWFGKALWSLGNCQNLAALALDDKQCGLPNSAPRDHVTMEARYHAFQHQ